MINTTFLPDPPTNEPVREYRPGAPETTSLKSKLKEMSSTIVEIPCIVDGEEVFTGNVTEWTAPHDHSKVLCKWHASTPELQTKAIESSQRAWRQWSEEPPHVRVAIFQKAAELLAGPWRDTLNASTMLGQSKTCFQAEIDAACELIDFWRFNCHYALTQVYTDQPWSSEGIRNYVDHRPLEGFVVAITPFNFTSIGGNLPTAPALMGNVAIWKPSHSSMLSNYYVMKLLEEAGLPPGVVNLVPRDPEVGIATLMDSEHFAGLHYTGSSAVFQSLWQKIAGNLPSYRSYPRIVGETGGKNFIFAHESADVDALAIAALRGAFENQGQKCSAASRMYVPRKIWGAVRDRLVSEMRTIQMGDIEDFSNFMGAVINERAFTKISGYIDSARDDSGTKILQGGETSRDDGWFIQPTLLECTDPGFRTMLEEIFGPVLSVFVYDENKLEETLRLCDTTTPYALTGSVFAQDRLVAEAISNALRHAAGNFYINDKPTGAVVGQQPFGGARASGTDDKAGSALNLTRWVAPRTVKETYNPPTDYRYPHMG